MKAWLIAIGKALGFTLVGILVFGGLVYFEQREVIITILSLSLIYKIYLLAKDLKNE